MSTTELIWTFVGAPLVGVALGFIVFRIFAGRWTPIH